MSDMTAEKATAWYPTFKVEGLMGETVTVAVAHKADEENFGKGTGHDPEFDYGFILDYEKNTAEGFWFETGYWAKVN